MSNKKQQMAFFIRGVGSVLSLYPPKLPKLSFVCERRQAALRRKYVVISKAGSSCAYREQYKKIVEAIVKQISTDSRLQSSDVALVIHRLRESTECTAVGHYFASAVHTDTDNAIVG
jgi:hypothetical protein